MSSDKSCNSLLGQDPLMGNVDVENGTSNKGIPRWVLWTSTVGGLLALMALAAFVTVLSVRANELEEHYERMIQDEPQAIHDTVPQGEKAPSRRGERSADQIRHDTPDLYKNSGDQSGEPSAIHLTGSSSYQTMTKEDGFHVIDNWSVSLSDDSNFKLVNHSFVEIRESGTYLIYAQLSWRKRQGLASYSVKNTRAEEGESLASCVTSFSDKYAQLESCYTSVSVPLQSGDKVYVAIQNENLTLDFKQGRAFFGVTVLSRSDGKGGEDSSLS